MERGILIKYVSLKHCGFLQNIVVLFVLVNPLLLQDGDNQIDPPTTYILSSNEILHHRPRRHVKKKDETILMARKKDSL